MPILQKHIDDNNIKTYIEPFVGGANVIDKIVCEERIGSDYSKDLITLLKYIQRDNKLSIAPDTCSFSHYADVRNNRNTGKYSQEYIALIGYCASYGGRYFDGGFARNSRNDNRDDSSIKYTNNLKNLRNQSSYLNDIEFYCKDYMEYLKTDIKNALFYLDPPYKNTKIYNKQKIKYDEFYDFCRMLSKNNIVIISEYDMPDDFICIWSKERKILQKSNRTSGDKALEKLFIYKP